MCQKITSKMKGDASLLLVVSCILATVGSAENPCELGTILHYCVPNSILGTKQRTDAVADLEGGGAEPAPPPPYGRRTDAVTRGIPDMWQRYMATPSPFLSLQARKTWYGE